MRRMVTPADIPCLAQLCYWGSDPVVKEYDHEVVAVVAGGESGFILLLGPEETEVHVGAEADLIWEDS